MAGADSAKEIQALNRGSERVYLRERKVELRRDGPSNRHITGASGLDAEEVREEACELSIFFIEDAWTQLRALLDSYKDNVLLLRADKALGRFVPVTQEDVGDLASQTTNGDDPLTRLAIWAELLLRSIGSFTERRQATRSFSPTEDPRLVALYVRYCDLLSNLRPAQTPTSHGIVNSLAGLQVTLALCEVIPAVHAQQAGAPISRALYRQILGAPELSRLILAIASTRSQASNAMLAELLGPRFDTWRHSLLPRPDGSRPQRLQLRPECFELVPGADAAAPPSLQLRPQVMSAIRERAEHLVTPGRSRQTMCPAFFADAATGKGAVIQDFVGWLMQIVERYYVGFFP